MLERLRGWPPLYSKCRFQTKAAPVAKKDRRTLGVQSLECPLTSCWVDMRRRREALKRKKLKRPFAVAPCERTHLDRAGPLNLSRVR